MSDFFTRLAARALGLAPVARPAVISRFEPAEFEPVIALEQLASQTPKAASPTATTPEPTAPSTGPMPEASYSSPRPAPQTSQPEVHRIERHTFDHHTEITVQASPPAVVPTAAPPVLSAASPNLPPVTHERETVLTKTELLRERELRLQTESHTLHQHTESAPTINVTTPPQPPLATRPPQPVAERRRAEPAIPRVSRERHGDRAPQPSPIHITIGRVEVRPPQQRTQPPAPDRKVTRGPVLPLDRYLKEQG